MEHDFVIGEIQDRWADIQHDGHTVNDAIADVLYRYGYVVLSKQHYDNLVAYRAKYVQILKIVES